MPSSTLFADFPQPALPAGLLGAGTAILSGYALRFEADLIDALAKVEKCAPFRHMVTRGGFPMSVAMTNCGALGWITDRTGYRYDAVDPETGLKWPKMPKVFAKMAGEAAATAGFDSFEPDACLLNRYEPGARLSLHQDRNESDYSQPIVSVSLGLPATFLFGGEHRSDPTVRLPVQHGDVIVWGGPARLRFHGVAPLREGEHPRLGRFRYNLTFRKAG